MKRLTDEKLAERIALLEYAEAETGQLSLHGESELACLCELRERRGSEGTLQQKLDAMAAENAALKKILTPPEIPEEAITAFENTIEFDHDFKEGNSWTWVDNETEVIRAVLAAMSLPETPATDDYLNSVRAEGVDMVADSLIENGVCTSSHTVGYFKQFAAHLRSGTHDTADKAGAK